MEKETALQRLQKLAPDLTLTYKPLKGFFMLEAKGGNVNIWRRIGTSERNAIHYINTLKEGR